MLPWKCQSDHYPVRFGARCTCDKRDPQVTTLPQWIANHKLFLETTKRHFSSLDTEGIDNVEVERPWSRLDRLKEAFKRAAQEIEETCKAEEAQKADALPILIALARLMEQSNPAHRELQHARQEA
jgi:hypothetical protein